LSFVSLSCSSSRPELFFIVVKTQQVFVQACVPYSRAYRFVIVSFVSTIWRLLAQRAVVSAFTRRAHAGTTAALRIHSWSSVVRWVLLTCAGLWCLGFWF